MDYMVLKLQDGMKPHDYIKCIVKNTFLEIADTDPSQNVSSARRRSASEGRASSVARHLNFNDDEEDAKEDKYISLFPYPEGKFQIFGSFSTIPSIDAEGLSSASTRSDGWEEPTSSPRSGSCTPPEISNSHQQTLPPFLPPYMACCLPPTPPPCFPPSLPSPLPPSLPPSVPACHEEDEKLRVESMKSQSREHPTLATRRLQKTKDEVLESLQQLTDLAAKEQLTREDLEKNEVTDHLYPYIPFNDEGDITSLGSILHAEGACKPCVFLKKDRCHKKDLCLYCHFEHDVKQPNGGSKHARIRKRRARHLSSESGEAI